MANEDCRKITIDGQEFTTFVKTITSANILEVEAGTNGSQGGDSGHGCRTYIRISNESSTDIRVKPIGEYGEDGVEIVLGGDCELATFIEGLKFIVRTLEKQDHRISEKCVNWRIK